MKKMYYLTHSGDVSQIKVDKYSAYFVWINGRRINMNNEHGLYFISLEALIDYSREKYKKGKQFDAILKQVEALK